MAAFEVLADSFEKRCEIPGESSLCGRGLPTEFLLHFLPHCSRVRDELGGIRDMFFLPA
jgi:hypothetical protein